jgi:hypothetical protein
MEVHSDHLRRNPFGADISFRSPRQIDLYFHPRIYAHTFNAHEHHTHTHTQKHVYLLYPEATMSMVDNLPGYGWMGGVSTHNTQHTYTHTHTYTDSPHLTTTCTLST